MKKTVLLTFDIEEFDMPLEYGASLPLARQLQVSAEGTRLLLSILDPLQITATFFSTVVFAESNPNLIKNILDAGHELASHSYYHSQFQPADLASSRHALEKISNTRITGFRMPRMMPVSNYELKKAGYIYNSSINPTYIPGRYNHLRVPRTIFQQDDLVQVPASVSPLIRLPLFWLSFHLLPAFVFKSASMKTINKDGYLNLYFHPWEFIDLSPAEFGLPAYLTYNTGEEMVKKFKAMLLWMRSENYAFTTIHNYLTTQNFISENRE